VGCGPEERDIMLLDIMLLFNHVVVVQGHIVVVGDHVVVVVAASVCIIV
jgi:hypothetical protein